MKLARIRLIEIDLKRKGVQIELTAENFADIELLMILGNLANSPLEAYGHVNKNYAYAWVTIPIAANKSTYDATRFGNIWKK